jgi:DNA-binding transcriptional MerR regulator
MERMTVSQLARQSGTAADTIRYYTRVGLLPEPPRSDAGYRLFGSEVLDRLAFIKRAQRLGLSLEAIQQLLHVADEGGCPCGSTRQMLEHRLEELDRELTALTDLREDIAGLLDDLPEERGDDGWCCPTQLVTLQRRSEVDEERLPPQSRGARVPTRG